MYTPASPSWKKTRKIKGQLVLFATDVEKCSGATYDVAIEKNETKTAWKFPTTQEKSKLPLAQTARWDHRCSWPWQSWLDQKWAQQGSRTVVVTEEQGQLQGTWAKSKYQILLNLFWWGAVQRATCICSPTYAAIKRYSSALFWGVNNTWHGVCMEQVNAHICGSAKSLPILFKSFSFPYVSLCCTETPSLPFSYMSWHSTRSKHKLKAWFFFSFKNLSFGVCSFCICSFARNKAECTIFAARVDTCPV